MSVKQVKMKQDKFRHARGGWSRLLEIRCEHCETVVASIKKTVQAP